MSKLKKFVLLFFNLAFLFSPFVNACKKPPSKINTYSRKSCKKLTAAEIAAEIAASRKLEIDTYSRKSCKKLAEAETAAAAARQKLEIAQTAEAKAEAKSEEEQMKDIIFDGILNHFAKLAKGNTSLFSHFICFIIDHDFTPTGKLTKTPCRGLKVAEGHYYQSHIGKNSFIGVRFEGINVIRPTAIALKIPARSLVLANSSVAPGPDLHALGSFIIVGKFGDGKPEILGEYNRERRLYTPGYAVFYVNTDRYFNHIYVQQLGGRAFGPGGRIIKSDDFQLEWIEIHGELKQFSFKNDKLVVE